MQLIVLGSAGTYPTPGRPCSGYLLRHRETSVWIDAGTGSFAALQAVTDFRSLDAIVVSHGHADHCSDLFSFANAVAYGAEPRWGIPTYAPADVAERMVRFLGDENHATLRVFDFRPVEEGSRGEVEGIPFGFGSADHSVPSVTIRAEAEGKVLAYSGDTGKGGSVREIARGADVFLAEATFQGEPDQKPWEHHLTAGEAGEIGREAGADDLVLTHLWPTLHPDRSIAEAEETFGRPVSLAVPGRTIDI